MAARNYIELVEKTLRVLESLGDSTAGIKLGELAGRVGLVKSSVFRILFTLNKLGYVEKVGPEGVYAFNASPAGAGARIGPPPRSHQLRAPPAARDARKAARIGVAGRVA